MVPSLRLFSTIATTRKIIITLSTSSTIPVKSDHAIPAQWADYILPPSSRCIVRRRAVCPPAATKRAAEFADGRHCAGQLLQAFGVDSKVGVADDRAPIWPVGFTGSISHSEAWVACAVTPTQTLASIGIDTERIASREVRDDVMDTIATDAEWKLIEQFCVDDETAFTLLFSAKEAFYKCWFPVVKAYFDFFDVELVSANRSSLTLKVLSSNPAYGVGPDRLVVEYLVHDDNVFTVTWIESRA